MPEHHLTHLADIRMTDTERAALRARLRAFMALNPVPAARSRAARWFMRHAVALAAAVLIVVAGATGVSAERSSPGDLLYGFRTAVNDRVIVSLSFGDDARIDTEFRQIERILEEEDAAREQTLGDIAYTEAAADDGYDFERELEAIERELGAAEQDGAAFGDAPVPSEAFDDGTFEAELRAIERELDAENAVDLELD